MSRTPMRETAATLAEVTAEAELGTLRSQVKALMNAIAYVDAEAPRLEKEARTAWAKRNQKALTHARSTLVDWLLVGNEVGQLRSGVERWRTAHPEVASGCDARVQRLVDELERAGDSVKRLDRTVRELVALGQVPTEQEPAAPWRRELRTRLGGLLGLSCARPMALHDV